MVGDLTGLALVGTISFSVQRQLNQHQSTIRVPRAELWMSPRLGTGAELIHIQSPFWKVVRVIMR